MIMTEFNFYFYISFCVLQSSKQERNQRRPETRHERHHQSWALSSKPCFTSFWVLFPVEPAWHMRMIVELWMMWFLFSAVNVSNTVNAVKYCWPFWSKYRLLLFVHLVQCVSFRQRNRCKQCGTEHWLDHCIHWSSQEVWSMRISLLSITVWYLKNIYMYLMYDTYKTSKLHNAKMLHLGKDKII